MFAGTPDFAASVMTAIINSPHNIIACYTQPDRPAGRGRKLTASPVKALAQEHDIPVYQPLNFKQDEDLSQLQALNADLMVVVAYGIILPKAVLETPRLGCINVHASLLPRWRGAAPIQRAILAGDKQTGVGIMQMNEGLDTGNILLEKTCAITKSDTAHSLHDKLAILGAQAIVEALAHLDDLSPTIQNEDGVTYAKKLSKEEAWIDWSQSAIQINQQIRAFNPYPIAQAHAQSDKFEDKVLRVLSASVIDLAYDAEPGEVIKYGKGICITATGDSALSLEQVQLAGKKIANIKDFTNAYNLTKLS